MRPDPYSTHLPLLKQLAHGTAVEFGLGLHSTPELLKRCSSLLSVEMQSKAWSRKTRAHLRREGRPMYHWTATDAIGAWQFLGVEYPSKIDFGLVDGHAKSRFGCVNFLMRLGCPVIVAHDTEARVYKWKFVKAHGYQGVTDKSTRPYTSVWVSDDRVPARGLQLPLTAEDIETIKGRPPINTP